MPWWRHAREHYLDLAAASPPTTTSFYYDPVLDVHHRLPVRAALTTSFYAAPQEPADARRLFDAAVADVGYDRPLRRPLEPNRVALAALFLAREWGLDHLDGRLTEVAEESWEPTWDHERGEFTWGLGFGEVHPRGQYNAFLAAAEAGGVGAWARLAHAPLDRCPQVVGVDFPTVALSRAEWMSGSLQLTVEPHRDDPGASTSFDVTGLHPAELEHAPWTVAGHEGATVERVDVGLRVTVPVVKTDLVLSRGS